MNVPLAVGVPLIVIVFPDQLAVTPVGRPVATPIPVAPLVVWVMSVIAALIQTVGVDDAIPAVLEVTTVIIPVALTVPQPPVNGIV